MNKLITSSLGLLLGTLAFSAYGFEVSQSREQSSRNERAEKDRSADRGYGRGALNTRQDPSSEITGFGGRAAAVDSPQRRYGGEDRGSARQEARELYRQSDGRDARYERDRDAGRGNDPRYGQNGPRGEDWNRRDRYAGNDRGYDHDTRWNDRSRDHNRWNDRDDRHDRNRWNDRDRYRHVSNDWRQDWRHAEWRRFWHHGWSGSRYRAPVRYYYPRGYSARDWRIGWVVPSVFLLSNYWVDYRDYALAPPPYGCRWVRVDADLLLVDVDSGEIVDILFRFYY